MVWKIFAGMGCGGRNFSMVWKSFFHSVEIFWGVGGARCDFFHGVEIIFP